MFSDSSISDKEAQSLLDKQPDIDHARTPTADAHDSDEPGKLSDAKTYELMRLNSHPFLCSIPVIEPAPPENQTENELAKAQELEQLNHAVGNGWSLISQLQDHCLYFMSGWWSYSFCKNQEIVQYHALPTSPAGQPPRRDPNTAEFVLGAVPAAVDPTPTNKNLANVELQEKGDSRYLVQRLVGGTVCDITGRERTIEVQYHCVPGLKHDRIAWIKEVTICAYMMVVNSPRLCDEVAFLPPDEQKANPIICRPIGEGATIPTIDQGTWEKAGDSVVEEAEANGAEATPGDGTPIKGSPESPLVVGGVVVGGRNIISGADEPNKPPTKLGSPENYFGGSSSNHERLIEMIIKAQSKEDGGKVEVLAADELEQLDIDPGVVQEMREEMQKIAGDLGWRLEIVEFPDEDLRELRGYVDEEGEEGEEAQRDDTKGSENRDEEGSKERYYKDEL